MELYISIKYDNIDPKDYSRDSDKVFREIHSRFPDAVWERRGLGYKVSTLD